MQYIINIKATLLTSDDFMLIDREEFFLCREVDNFEDLGHIVKRYMEANYEGYDYKATSIIVGGRKD